MCKADSPIPAALPLTPSAKTLRYIPASHTAPDYTPFRNRPCGSSPKNAVWPSARIFDVKGRQSPRPGAHGFFFFAPAAFSSQVSLWRLTTRIPVAPPFFFEYAGQPISASTNCSVKNLSKNLQVMTILGGPGWKNGTRGIHNATSKRIAPTKGVFIFQSQCSSSRMPNPQTRRFQQKTRRKSWLKQRLATRWQVIAPRPGMTASADQSLNYFPLKN